MAFTLPPLPWANDSLSPTISAETIEYHYGKHHKTYIDNLNKFAAGTKYESMSLEDVIKASRADGDKKIFNNSAQVWNHTFFWNSLAPKAGGNPTGAIAAAIDKSFGSFGDFKTKFSEAAAAQFGSGWAWLVKNADGSLAIETTSNAETPFGQPGKTCVLTLDVWEHAYYIDYRNARPKFIEAWWTLVNWDFANKNLA